MRKSIKLNTRQAKRIACYLKALQNRIDDKEMQDIINNDIKNIRDKLNELGGNYEKKRNV